MIARIAPILVAAFIAAATAAPCAADDPAATPWTASAGLGFTATSGNSETTSLALSLQATREADRIRWNTGANLAVATTGGDETANNGGLHTQLDYLQTERFYYFGRVGFEYDRFANLDLRTSPGAGVGYTLLGQEGAKFGAGVGANAVTDFFSDGTKDTRGTLSFVEELSLALTETAALTHNFNVQNNFNDFGDYLINAEVSLSAKMSGQLSLKASLLDKYDSTPFSAALKNNDLTFITSLNYTL